MSEYTPTTQAVRRVYSMAPVDLEKGGFPNTSPDYAAAQFDRWLDDVKAEARNAAFLEEAQHWSSDPVDADEYEFHRHFSARGAGADHHSAWRAACTPRTTPTEGASA